MAIITGTYLAGELIPKYINPKKLFIISYIPVAIAIGAYGFSKTLFQFEVAGVLGSFFVGTGICSNNILMSYYSTPDSLGKNFSFLASSSLVATVAGGFVVGPLIQKLGNYWAFGIFGTSLLLCSILLFYLQSPEIETVTQKKQKFSYKRDFVLLLLSILSLGLLLYGFKLGISIMLKSRGWQMQNVSLSMAFGTLMALPVALWWCKIVKYKNAFLFLSLIFLSAILAYFLLFGVGVYIFAVLGFFFISVVAYAISIPVMQILFQWFDKDALPKAQSLYNSSTWGSAIIGFALDGLVIQHLGEKTFIFIGVLIALVGFIFLRLIKK